MDLCTGRSSQGGSGVAARRGCLRRSTGNRARRHGLQRDRQVILDLLDVHVGCLRQRFMDVNILESGATVQYHFWRVLYRAGIAPSKETSMELKQMRYFLALAQERNFGRAAERLHMAQPPLTRQIQAIEEELGSPLFVRISKGVELTEAGKALLAEVPSILALADRSTERTRRAGKGLVGRLEVGTFGSSILDVVPRVLLNFHKLRPEVAIGLHSMDRGQQIRALREREISIGFARL